MNPRSEPGKPAAIRNSLKTPEELGNYFKRELDSRLGTPPTGVSVLNHWVSQQSNFDFEQAKTIIRLFIIVDMGATYKPNLLPSNPWTKLDDIDHIFPEAGASPPLNIQKLGNLTLLTPAINKSIKDMTWADKRQIYSMLSSVGSAPPQTKLASGASLPKAVASHLADLSSPCQAHLGSIASQSVWNEQAIYDRTNGMLENVWSVLYKKWLVP